MHETQLLHKYIPNAARTSNRTRASRATKARCSGGFYITNSDLVSGYAVALARASAMGPQALAAAFTALSAMVGGSIGAAIAGVIGILGTGFFIALGIQISGALFQRKGICVRLQWDNPPIKTSIE